MYHSVILFAAIALFLLVGSVEIRAQGCPRGQVPKVVVDTLLAKFPKAKIDKCSKAKEGGQVVYDIEFTQEGRSYEADISEKGTYINQERAIDTRDLPKLVSDAVQKRYPNSTVKKVMEELKGDGEELSGYEVVLLTANKKYVELIMSPDGKILEDTGAQMNKTNRGRARPRT